MKKLTVIAALTGILAFTQFASARMLEIENTYIKASVDDASARFSLETLQGDPDVPGDDNQDLLYKKVPPTSLTTLYINDEPFIFGSAQGYFITRPEVRNNKIVTEWSVKGVVIVQEITLEKNPSTGREDAMRILYKIKNENRRKTEVGLRLLLDTSVGDKKAASFQVPGSGYISTETQFYRRDMPAFWYAFDDNDNPQLRTQAVLSGSGITTPDKLVFASWSRLFDNLWDIGIDASKDMRKSGTGYYDGAVAQYYEPLGLQQNEMMLITAYYGMYGVSFFSSEDLSVTMSVPAEPKTMPVPVNVEIKNKGKATLDKLQVELVLPEGFSLAAGQQSTYEFVKVEAGTTRQTLWNISSPVVSGDVNVQVRAKGWLEDNQQSVLASKIFSMQYSQDLIVKDDTLLKDIENQVVVALTNTNTAPVVTNQITNLIVKDEPVLTNEVVNITTNTVTVYVEEEVKPVISQQELDLIEEIESLDELIDSINNKYQVLLEIYRNSYQPDEALQSVDRDLENLRLILQEQEATLSNQLQLYRE